MKINTYLISLFFGCAALLFSGCAFLSKGSTQAVVIRSTPEGAEVKVNGTIIGKTPLRVPLPRQDLYRIDVAAPGFAPQAALITPTSENYRRRVLQWGIDYDLGAAKDLVPEVLIIELKPALSDYSAEDRYIQMVGQITRADALLASGEINLASHRYLVAQILSFYN